MVTSATINKCVTLHRFGSNYKGMYVCMYIRNTSITYLIMNYHYLSQHHLLTGAYISLHIDLLMGTLEQINPAVRMDKLFSY